MLLPMLLSSLLPPWAPAPTGQDPGPGISIELARARAASIRDVHYWLRFRIEPGAKLVQGETWLRFSLARDREPRPVVLDFGGQDLAEVKVNEKDATLVAVHDHLLVPANLLVAGPNTIAAKFAAPIAESGTPLTVYRDPADGREYYYTLVVPADAHRLYPCFDQPDLKARFTLELDLPDQWVAVANGAEHEDSKGGIPIPGGRRWAFRETAPLPTYLMAFACGPFDVAPGPVPAIAGFDARAPLRFFLRPGERKHFDAQALTRLHIDGLRWLVETFAVPYPFGKLDVVLLPGFPYGGMEHAGAIFYREQALLFDHPPTIGELVRRSTLVYHELSHQWFGNLVTMQWFDDLWLKEGFATFVAYQAMAALEPERQSWLRFLQRVKPRAYEVDGTPGTTPVFQELKNLADAKSAYGAIVYNKAPAVLRELHDRLGADAFRAGLKRYLEKHAFGNATWRDLALALESTSRADLGRWSSRWLLAPSMPQVRFAFAVDQNGVVTEAAVRQRPIEGNGTWPLRLQLLCFDLAGNRSTLEVSGDAESIPVAELIGRAAPACVLVNPGDVAYGQFVPDPQSRQWLLQHVGGERDQLVRAVMAAALFEAVREAELAPDRFAAVALTLVAQERDPDSHAWLLDAFGTCLERYLPEAKAAPLRRQASELLLGQLRDEPDSGRELSTFRFLAWHGSGDAVVQLCRDVVRQERLPQGLVAGKQDRFLGAAALLARGSGDGEIEWLRQQFAQADVGKELFLASAATPDPDAKARVWQQYLQLDKPPEQWAQDSLPFFHWPGQQALTLPYLRQALDRVDWVKANRRIFFMPAWLDGFVNGHSSPAALAIVDEFLAKAKLDDDVRRKLLQSRDGLARAVTIQRTWAPRGDGDSEAGR